MRVPGDPANQIDASSANTNPTTPRSKAVSPPLIAIRRKTGLMTDSVVRPERFCR
jgi:hypothetical protein